MTFSVELCADRSLGGGDSKGSSTSATSYFFIGRLVIVGRVGGALGVALMGRSGPALVGWPARTDGVLMVLGGSGPWGVTVSYITPDINEHLTIYTKPTSYSVVH